MYKLNDMVDHEKIEEGCCYILQGSDDIISYDVENFLEFLTEKEILVEQSKFNTI